MRAIVSASCWAVVVVEVVAVCAWTVQEKTDSARANNSVRIGIDRETPMILGHTQKHRL